VTVFGPKLGLATFLTPVVIGRKYMLSIQSLVLTVTFRCHFFVAGDVPDT
jgi:hypothetical protein